MKYKIDWFLIGMIAAVTLAWLFPEPGAHGGWLQPELLTSLGVSLIFFLNGASLSFAALKDGIKNWKIHLLVQGTVFLLFPLLGILLMKTTSAWVPEDLGLGIFYLCASPSTVSSSVALTAAARGNVPAAIFNATASSLIGVIVTPLWMTFVISTQQNSGDSPALPFGEVILQLMIWLVLPLVIGQICRPFLKDWIAKHRRFVSSVDRGTILLLIYTSFCDSMVLGIWTKYGLLAVATTFIAALALFYLVFWILKLTCKKLRFNREDAITTIFCGSKKSMATAVPMAQLMFGSSPGLGLILLPIMIYHPLQLVICGVLASRWRDRAEI